MSVIGTRQIRSLFQQGLLKKHGRAFNTLRLTWSNSVDHVVWLNTLRPFLQPSDAFCAFHSLLEIPEHLHQLAHTWIRGEILSSSARSPFHTRQPSIFALRSRNSSSDTVEQHYELGSSEGNHLLSSAIHYQKHCSVWRAFPFFFWMTFVPKDCK